MGVKSGYANIWTYKYYTEHYKEITGNQWDCVDYMFSALVQPRLPQLMQDTEFIGLLGKYHIFDYIEGYKLIPDISREFLSKFTGMGILSGSLSSGCKAALCMLYFSQKKDSLRYIVDMTEAGANAVTVCTNILKDNDNIVGMLSIAAEIDGKYWEVAANVNDEFVETWFDVMEICGSGGVA